ICSDLSLAKHGEFWIQDCSAAAQNLLLAAHAKGLGAVWLGVYPRDSRVEGLRDLLSIPKQIIPFCLIPIGHPNEKKSPVRRFDESRIHYNRW
ncbi:MAG: nitroreductase family protein, partial [Candidatus Hodarchaeota archaeon]